MAKVSAILFDFGGTLDCPRHWLDRFVVHYRDIGLQISRDELDPAYEYATQQGYAAAHEMGNRNLQETVRFLVGHQVRYLKMNGPPRAKEWLASPGANGRDRAIERVSEAFAEESIRGLGRSREVLAALKPRFRLGVVSNFYGNLDRILAESGLISLFETITDSSAIGIFKPDIRIFERALADLGLSGHADRAAMVGDSLMKDCAPARQLGMRAIFLQTSNSIGRSPSDFADTVIDSLEQIPRLEW